MFDLDAEVAKAHRAAEENEQQAKQVEARLRRIPGAAEIYKHAIDREYGEPIPVERIAANMTLRSLIQRNDPELAAFLKFPSALARREQEEREAHEVLKRTIELRTERLREQNAELAHRHRMMVNSGLNPVTGRLFGS